MAHLIGIDAARWQGVLPVSQLVDAGIRFAIVKATHGLGAHPDVQFAASWRALAGQPIIRGAYHWFTDQDPRAQAEHFVRTVGALRDVDLPLAIDFEEPSTIYRGNALLDRLRACLERVHDLTGRTPLLYTGAWYWDLYVATDAPDIVETYPLWHAQYPRVEIRDRRACGISPPALPAPTLPKPWRDRGVAEAIWQFDGDGGCVLPNGIDADFDRADEAVLRSLQRLADTLPAPPPEPGPTRPETPRAREPQPIHPDVAPIRAGAGAHHVDPMPEPEL